MGWTEHYGGRKEGRGRAGQGGVEPAVEMCGFVVRGKQQIRCHRPCILLYTAPFFSGKSKLSSSSLLLL